MVKGPQGALYGKNAIGGAINIYTQEPTNTSSNKIKLGYGNGNSLLGQFVSSGAISKDKVFYRVSAQYKKTDGLLTNQTLDRKVDFKKDFNFRGQIFGESTMLNNNANIKFDYTAGNVKFQSITSFNKVERTTSGDLDFLEYDDFTQNEITSTTTFNQEFRLQNRKSSDKVNWSIGGFYQNVEEPFFQDGLVRDFDTFEQFNFVAADLINKTSTIALFGFADYELSDKLTASAGFRFDIDNFEQEDLLFESVIDRKNNEIQPKVSLAYQASESALIYSILFSILFEQRTHVLKFPLE